MNKVLIIIFGILFATGASAWEFKPDFSSDSNNLNNKSNELINVQMKGQTQTDMNIEAIDDFGTAKKTLDNLLKKIRKYDYLNKEQLELLEKSQKQWESYAQTYAEFASSDYEGGSIQPMIRANIMTGLYKRKIEELKRDVENMKPL